ncbi:MAG: cytochrome-c peroxidase [Salibacteraceae bacterium]
MPSIINHSVSLLRALYQQRVLRFAGLAVLVVGLGSLNAREQSGSGFFPGAVSVSSLQVPEGFPEPVFPENNQFSEERWELGKMLFYEKSLSVDRSTSCASCHSPALSFADDKATTPGAFDRPGKRNAPSLANIAYHPYLLREGGVPTLEMQVLVPIQEENEFDHNMVAIVEQLKENADYQNRSQAAYGRPLDAFVLTRALGVFQRTLLSGNSAYDQYQRQPDALDAAQLRGMELFFSARTNCSSCHSGFNFTNYGFANNGLYLTYPDEGRRRVTRSDQDESVFKVPSLRNVAVTAPYMHDGSMQTLADVIAHYNSGGAAHPNKSELLHPLELTQQEQDDLAAFLEALTDPSFLDDKRWGPPVE